MLALRRIPACETETDRPRRPGVCKSGGEAGEGGARGHGFWRASREGEGREEEESVAGPRFWMGSGEVAEPRTRSGRATNPVSAQGAPQTFSNTSAHLASHDRLDISDGPNCDPYDFLSVMAAKPTVLLTGASKCIYRPICYERVPSS